MPLRENFLNRFIALPLLTFAVCLNTGCVPNHSTPNKGSTSLEGNTAKESIAPEPASQINAIKSQLGATYMAVTANPLATDAASRVLSSGGSAIDAGIAAQMVLGLVEPQSSGIGGGGFLLYWDNSEKKLYSYDGRETAPSSADHRLFLNGNNNRMSFFDAVVGGRSVGVPGLVAMLELAHQQHGKQAWLTLFDDAITLADEGFAVSPRLHQLITRVPKLREREELASYLFNADGNAIAVGQQLRNPAYANTLRHIAAIGASYVYHGEFAERLVEVVNRDSNPGQLSLEDMAQYQTISREPVCMPAFSYTVCGMGPPSSGGLTTLQILGILEASNANRFAADSSQFAHYFAEASRLAFADRNAYIADPAYVHVPTAGMLDPHYLAARAQLINPVSAQTDVSAGQPPTQSTLSINSSISPERPSTTHISIVDSSGNMLSMTTSIETAFGSRLMIDGVILNNQLTDFSFAPNDDNGATIANRAAAGKRPRSSMAPTIVLNAEGTEALMAIGSPGGARIINYVARNLALSLSGQSTLEAAIASRHIVHMGRSLELETQDKTHTTATSSTPMTHELEQLGHEVTVKAQTSGIHAVTRTNMTWSDKALKKWKGIADPRREGRAEGK